MTVEANAVGSVAAALAPMDALLDAASARTVITPAFIQNFSSPIADYGEIVNMAPNTFTTSSNGVGLGQSKTYFRGFPDGDYNIDFDGIPFYDTNTPSHHSWAFFPAQSIVATEHGCHSLFGGIAVQLEILPTRLRSIATSFSAFQIRKLGFLRPHCT